MDSVGGGCEMVLVVGDVIVTQGCANSKAGFVKDEGADGDNRLWHIEVSE